MTEQQKSAEQPKQQPGTSRAASETDPVPGSKAREQQSNQAAEALSEQGIEPPAFGPGSEINWDEPHMAPHKRHHIGEDPNGEKNAKLARSRDKDED